MDRAADRPHLLRAEEPEQGRAPRQAVTARSALKLTACWPVRLVVATLMLTTAAAGSLVWPGVGAGSAGTLAQVPLYLAVAAAVFWVVTLSLLSRWRAADREEHRRIVAHCDQLTRRVADLYTDISAREVTQQQTAEQLETRNQIIREHESRVGELEDVAEQALAAEREARDQNRAKSEYLAQMSRDIRAPLTTILGFAHTLLEIGDLSRAPASRVEALYTIKQKGEQLLDTINDTLELCEIELQQCQIDRRRCSLVEIVNQAHGLMAIWAEARGLRLLVEYHGQVPEYICTDRERLIQILVNLLGNAVKFTLNGDVRLMISLVSGDAEDPELHFEVLDSGIGMRRDQSDRLFAGFARATSDNDRNPRCSGLGLSISRRHAEMLGGDIVVLDTLPGIGTRIRLAISVGSLVGVEMIEPPRTGAELVQPAV
jgi:signal transduction histidine kinase